MSEYARTKSLSRFQFAHAWLIWLLSALFMFYKYAIEVSPSVMATTLMRSFDISGVALGNLAACYFYAYLLFQIPAGLLIDKMGPRRVTTLAIVLCAIGAWVFARADHISMACLGRFLTGAGAAFAAVNCLKLTANWFPPRRFAFMAGLMMTLAMLGAVGGQAPLSLFIEALDWRFAMKIIALAGFSLAILFWLIVRDRSPTHHSDKMITSEKLSLKAALKRVLGSSQAWWLSAYSGFAFAPLMVFGGLWGVSFLSEAFHLSQNLAAGAVSFIFIGFALGAPFFGWFSDWLGRRVALMGWGTFGSFICLTAVIYMPGLDLYLIEVLLFLFGFFISSFLLCFTMIREINAPILAATAIGFMNAFDALFGAFSDPLTGKLLDMAWEGTLVDGARVFSVSAYKAAFLTLPLYLLIALATLFKIKETYCKATEPSQLP